MIFELYGLDEGWDQKSNYVKSTLGLLVLCPFVLLVPKSQNWFVANWFALGLYTLSVFSTTGEYVLKCIGLGDSALLLLFGFLKTESRKSNADCYFGGWTTIFVV